VRNEYARCYPILGVGYTDTEFIVWDSVTCWTM